MNLLYNNFARLLIFQLVDKLQIDLIDKLPINYRNLLYEGLLL